MVNVLVVDDEQGLADLYAVWLSAEHSTEVAYSGSEGLEKCTARTDVVFLDRRMPDRSGEEVLAEIRERGDDCYVVMVTAVKPDLDIVDMGLDGYLTKPIAEADLHRAIDQFESWAEYDDASRELISLRKKRDILEAERSSSALAESESYGRLLDEIAALEEELGAESGVPPGIDTE